MNRRPLKDWELEKGIKIKSKKRAGTYTKKQFDKMIKTNYIQTKTEKGLEYLENM